MLVWRLFLKWAHKHSLYFPAVWNKYEAMLATCDLIILKSMALYPPSKSYINLIVIVGHVVELETI